MTQDITPSPSSRTDLRSLRNPTGCGNIMGEALGEMFPKPPFSVGVGAILVAEQARFENRSGGGVANLSLFF